MLPTHTKTVLKQWFEAHPGAQPSEAEKRRLSIESGLDLQLLNKYFVRRSAIDANSNPDTCMDFTPVTRKRPQKTNETKETSDGRRRKCRRTSGDSEQAGCSPTNIICKAQEHASSPAPSLRDTQETESQVISSAHGEASTGAAPEPVQRSKPTSPAPLQGPRSRVNLEGSDDCSSSYSNDMGELTECVLSHVSYALLLQTIREAGTCVPLSLDDSVECSLRAEAARSVTIAKHSCSVGLDTACSRYGALDVLFAALHTALSTLRGSCAPALSPALSAALALARYEPRAPAPSLPQHTEHTEVINQAERSRAPMPRRDTDLDVWFARTRTRTRRRTSSSGTASHIPERGSCVEAPRAVFALPVGAACTDDRYMAERTFTGLVHRVLAHDVLALLLHGMCGGSDGGMDVPVLRVARTRSEEVRALAIRAGISCGRSRYGYLDVLFGGLLGAFTKLCTSTTTWTPSRQALRGVLVASGMVWHGRPRQVGVSALASAALRNFARTRSRSTERWWAVLEAWFDDNSEDPYPDNDTLWLLTKQSGLTLEQVDTYLRNKRLEQRPRTRRTTHTFSFTPRHTTTPTPTPTPTPVSAVKAIAALSARARRARNATTR